ncbi:hypothetical protein V8F06_007170 [Rhypophila decipiens]
MPQAIENIRIILILVLVFWVLTSGDVDTPLTLDPSASNSRLARQRHALQVLNAAEWGDFSPDLPNGYLNLTGFRQDDGYAWEDLDRFRGRCREWSRNAFSFVAHGDGGTGENDWVKGPEQITWLNASGTVSGEWVRQPGTSERQATHYNLSAISPGLGWPAGHTEWDRNITGSYGTVLVRLSEGAEDTEYEEKAKDRKPLSSDLVREVSASVEFQDVASGSSSWDMHLHGVHWPRQGAILLSTTSEKFAGIFGLPHLAPGEHFFNTSQQLLNKTIQETLERSISDTGNPWTSELSGTEDPWSLTPHCEYVMYLQLHSIESSLHSPFFDVADLENELRHPSGAPIGRIPPLRMSLVAWSPDCSYFLESKGPPHYAAIDGQHLVGMKDEVYNYTASRMLLTFGAVLLGQLWLFQQQIRETSTPSTKGRVSFYTASMMLLADGVVFSAASAWSLSAISSLLPVLVVSFASLMLMTLEVNFLRDVYHIQAPQRRSRTRPTNNTPRATTPPPALAENNNNTLPQPVTAGPPRVASPPIIIPSDQDIDAEIAEATAAGAAAVPSALPQTTTTTTNPNTQPAIRSFSQVVTFLFLIGTVLLFITAASSSWAVTIRTLYRNTITFTYFSMWIPQIVRNILRNSRQAFSWRFIIGQSTLRLVPFAYFYLYEDNFLFVKTDPRTFCFLLGWVWCQFCYLWFQDVLGPRTGIPRFLHRWLPEVWDYHPLLKEDNIESGVLPIGLSKCDDSPGGGRATRSGSIISQSSTKTTDILLAGGSSSSSSGERDRERDKEAERSGIKICCVDCTICKEVLEVPVVKEGAAEPAFANPVAGLFARRAYMVTPCRHIFHTECLGGWLKVRLQCPICREALPPL